MHKLEISTTFNKILCQTQNSQDIRLDGKSKSVLIGKLEFEGMEMVRSATAPILTNRIGLLRMNYQESDRNGEAGSPSLLIKFGSAI